MTSKKINRRNVIQLASSGCVAALAGCSGILGSDGPDNFEEDDVEEAMVTLDYFPDGWEVANEDLGGDDDEFGNDDEPLFDSGTGKLFSSEDGQEAVGAILGVNEDTDAAKEAVDDYTSQYLVDSESVDLGDGGKRGTLEEFGLVMFSYSNVGVLAIAVEQSGTQLEPMHGRAYEVGEDLLENLKSL
jgi:hypothetical protein